MATQLLDRFGYPVSSGGSGRLIETSKQDPDRRPQWEVRLESIHKGVTYQDWRTIVSASRRLCFNFPVLEAAIAAKSMHAVGRAWDPYFEGENQQWGEIAASWLKDEWFGICDVEGEVFDWKTSLYLDSCGIDQDGDFGVVFTQTAGGYPKLQHLGCDRIGQRQWGSKVVGPEDAWSTIDNGDGTYQKRKGVYAGMRIDLGVIRNQFGTPVAARVLGATAEDDQDVSLSDMMLRFDPRARGQLRGLPAASGAIEFLASGFEAHDAEMRAAMIASFVAVNEWNDSGAADPTDAANVNAPSSAEPTRETWEKGMFRYFRAGTGQKMEFVKNDRPGDAWESFQDRIIRIALGPIWPYALCWKPDGMNGTQERSEIEKARAFVKDRQDLLRPVARRQIGWAVSKAIKLGILPPYTGSDAGKGGQLKWDFEMPAEFSIDHGREDQQMRENYKMGLATKTEYLGRIGKRGYDKHQQLREMEVRDVFTRAQGIAKEFAVPMDLALAYMEQRSANLVTAPAQQEKEEPKPDPAE